MRTLGLIHVTTVPESLEFFRGPLDYMMRRLLRRHRPLIVHAHTPKAGCWGSSPLWRRRARTD
jgi:hypothetical protein